MQQKILILGGTGMLGQELSSLFMADTTYEVKAPKHSDVGVTDIEALIRKIHELQPHYIINAVAYNAVDLCEDDDKEYQKALQLNRDVPEALARVAKQCGSILVHYSTDYVFGNNQIVEEGFTEETIPIPNCKYALSKYLGEQALQKEGGKVYIIRLSRLFGKPAKNGKKSFFETMATLANTKSELEVVDDEISCFTYAPDLAQATRSLLVTTAPYGVYHLVNEGASSWYEGLSTLFTLHDKDTLLHRVYGGIFVRKAKRPTFSVLANTKQPLLRNYKEALQDYMITLENKADNIQS